MRGNYNNICCWSDYMEVDEVQPDHKKYVEDHAGMKNDVEEFAISVFIVRFVIHKISSVYNQG